MHHEIMPLLASSSETAARQVPVERSLEFSTRPTMRVHSPDLTMSNSALSCSIREDYSDTSCPLPESAKTSLADITLMPPAHVFGIDGSPTSSSAVTLSEGLASSRFRDQTVDKQAGQGGEKQEVSSVYSAESVSHS